LTLGDQSVKKALPLMTPLFWPLAKAIVAGSLPMLLAKNETSFRATEVLQISTVVLPFCSWLAKAVLGYEITTGPALGGGGLQQRSGKAAVDLPSAAWEQISLSLAYTWVSMVALGMVVYGLVGLLAGLLAWLLAGLVVQHGGAAQAVVVGEVQHAAVAGAATVGHVLG
jgi:hypothetical protein